MKKGSLVVVLQFVATVTVSKRISRKIFAALLCSSITNHAAITLKKFSYEKR